MPNEFIIKNGLIVESGTTTVTGSITATGGFTGSLLGTASVATSLAGGALTNFIEGFSSVSQSTSFFSASNAAATVNFAIIPKGSGSIIAAVPDGLITGGNARGIFAIDFQQSRSLAAQVASGDYSVLVGGRQNIASAAYAFIGGGQNNTGSGQWSAVAGGLSNGASADYAFVGAGSGNKISSGHTRTAIVSGQNNSITNGPSAFIGAGSTNTINSRGDVSAIVAGNNNTVSQYNCFIGAGASNSVNGRQSAVVAGESNAVSGHTGNHAWSAIVGGSSNSASPAAYGFIGGGNANTIANSWFATLGGGQRNSSRGFYNFVGGGTLNTGSSPTAVTSATVAYTASSATANLSAPNANIKIGQILFLANSETPSTLYVTAVSGTVLTLSANASSTVSTSTSFFTPHATIGGGGNNIASGSYTFVGGGGDGGTKINGNYALADWSLVVGGRANRSTQDFTSVVGGINNLASNTGSFVGGGQFNTGSGQYSVLTGGSGSVASADYSIVTGGNQGSATLYGQQAHASGRFTTTGDAQAHELIWRSLVTGTSPTELFLDGSSTRAILPTTNTIWRGVVDIAAVCTNAGGGTTIVGDVAAGSYEVTIKRLNTSTTLVGTVQIIGTLDTDASMSTANFTIGADDTNEALIIIYIPPATADGTTTFRVVATFRGLQIQY